MTAKFAKKTPPKEEFAQELRREQKSRESTIINCQYLCFKSFCEKYSQGRQLDCIKYFGAIYPVEIDPARHHQDHELVKRLEASGIIFDRGSFVYDQDIWKKTNDIKKCRLREKGVDVRLTLELMADAFYGKLEDVFIVSHDTDLVPAMEKITKLGLAKDIKFYYIGFKNLEAYDNHATHIRLYLDDIKKFDLSKKLTPTSEGLEKLKNKFGK